MWFEIGAAFAVAGIVLLGRDAARLSPAALLAFLFVVTRLLRRASSLMNHAQMLAGMLPSFGRVAALLEACEAEAEGSAATPAAVGDAVDLRREIRLEGVTFRYRPDAPPAVDGLDLEIPVGATVALVGPSGAGKSTVADLVTGLLRSSTGRILVDGEPLGPERLGAWRSRLGYVSQDPFLFHGSVRANLLWAKPDATDADLEEALRAADALEVVRRLPRGLDTPVGDRGATLSGGERQRIALARALVRRPALLVLDEATSHLDAESEERIRQAIESLRGLMTILVVAHRLGTVRRADRIHVMEGGRIVESDGWEGLLARPGGRFRALAAAQGLVTAR
jgi:ATP-binding cassette subfamily C protein